VEATCVLQQLLLGCDNSCNPCGRGNSCVYSYISVGKFAMNRPFGRPTLRLEDSGKMEGSNYIHSFRIGIKGDFCVKDHIGMFRVP
jgi:hypothetical protein